MWLPGVLYYITPRSIKDLSHSGRQDFFYPFMKMVKTISVTLSKGKLPGFPLDVRIIPAITSDVRHGSVDKKKKKW